MGCENHSYTYRAPVAMRIQNSCQRFNLHCAAASLVAIATALSASLWLQPSLVDFGQFYMGGTVARLGEWEALYPRSLPDSTVNAGYPTGSQMKPRYQELAERTGVGHTFRYILPPPTAILFVPLTALPFPAAKWAWAALLVLCGWGTALLTGRLYRRLDGGSNRWEGLLVFAIALAPTMVSGLRAGNVSPILAACIASALLVMIDPSQPPRRGERFAAAAIVLGALLKYATLALVPLLLAMRRWRLIAWGLGFGAMGVTLTLPLTGLAPWREFVTEIAPTLGRPAAAHNNQSLPALLLRSSGGETVPPVLRRLTSLGQWVSLALILLLVFTRESFVWRTPANIMAAAGALLLWLCVFSPIFWQHYYLYLCPFWAWLLWESRRCTRWAIAAAIVVLLAIVPAWMVLPRIGIQSALLNSQMLWSMLLMLGMAMMRLLRPVRMQPSLSQ
jgi:alpha-1,2-mannosyltransferase